MLVFSLLSLLFSFLSSAVFFSFFCCFLLLLFFSSMSSFSFQSLSVPFLFDETSLYMVIMSVFVLFISFLSVKTLSKSVTFVLTALLVSCVFVFTSSNALSLFFFYEASIFPILFIILKWGSYPERSLSAIMLLVYTMVFTLPFLYVLFFMYGSHSTFSLLSLSFLPPISSELMVLIFVLAFSVKLPIYGLHFWLPMAHVEAPTFGSMILAGVLLKLGGVGLIRLMPVFELGPLRLFLLSYSMVFIVFTTFVCCSQSDFKRLIAYSSVSHMMALIPLVLSNTDSGCYSMVLLMLFHGISSPLLFFLVGFSYELHATRQLSLLRGFITLSPLLSLAFTFGFFFTLSAPPFPSFFSEVFFIMGALSVSALFAGPLLLFTFFSLVYNLNWFSTILFNSWVPTSNYHYFSGKSFSVVALSFFVTVLFLMILLLSNTF